MNHSNKMNYIHTTRRNNTIIIICTAPLVTIEVKKPINEPRPVFKDCLNPLLVTKSSAMTAPKNGPSKMPATGITKGPTKRPIVLPQIPAFDPPYFLTPKALLNASAPKSKMRNKISATQNHHGNSLNEKNNPYKRNPQK